MKKLAILFVICAGLTIASCGNKIVDCKNACDSDTTLVDSIALDSTICLD